MRNFCIAAATILFAGGTAALARGLIRIAAMPKRPGQHDKGADPDVLPVVEGGIAVLVRPMQRRGRF
jgi:hypothetical protein